MKRLPVRSARAVLAVVAAATLLHSGPATAQSATRLGSIRGSASASGLTAYYNPMGILPIAPPLDFGAPDALATISNGPATFARASAADPGDLLANPDALLAQGGAEPGTVPPYPYRVQASSAVGAPSAESAPAPGLDARVHAEPTGSQATAIMPAVSGPAVLTVGSLASTATTMTDGSSVTVFARSEIHDAAFLGIIKFGSIVTDLTAHGDSQTVDVAGATTVGNASVAGRPVTIDANGVHLTGGPSGAANPALVDVNQLLQAAGIRITLSAPFEQEGAGAGQLSSGGLRIDLEISDRTLPALATLRTALPPLDSPIPGAPGIEDVLALTKARNLIAVGLGRGAVSLSVRPALATAAPSPTTTPTTSASPVAPGVASPPRPAAPSSPSLAAAAPAASESTKNVSGIGFSEGIGVIAILALLVQPLFGDRLVRASNALLADDYVTACPQEGR